MDEYGRGVGQGITTGIIAVLVIVALIGCCGIGYVADWFGFFAQGAEEVIKEELDPVELQRKYEWFKDAAASLDAKLEDIEAYNKKLATIDDAYEGISRGEWPDSDRRQYMQWQTEQVGIITSYNKLAGEYNADMVKWNYRFTNVGQLPEGQDEVLPREYRTYVSE